MGASTALEVSEDCCALSEPKEESQGSLSLETTASLLTVIFTPFDIRDNWSHTLLCNNLVVGKTFENAGHLSISMGDYKHTIGC